MKFVHIADMHFDSPFVNLSNKENLGEIRRLDQRKAFKKVIEYIKENNIEFLFIAGDLYEQKYIRKSTIEYINNLFMQIPNTKIYITPGNHDPFIKNSYYNDFSWIENVKIFNSKIEKIELEDIDIYGYALSKRGIFETLSGKGYIMLATALGFRKNVIYNYSNTTNRIGGGTITLLQNV